MESLMGTGRLTLPISARIGWVVYDSKFVACLKTAPVVRYGGFLRYFISDSNIYLFVMDTELDFVSYNAFIASKQGRETEHVQEIYIK